jgi:AraC-like DNA-binding protein
VSNIRAIFEHIEPTSPLSWKLFPRREPHFDFQWHFHHEYELTLIVEGSGTRIVGDCVQPYEPGDLTFIGPEMPHTYVSTPGQLGQSAVIVQFRRDFLGRELFERPEFSGVADLLERAARGISFPPGTVDVAALVDLPPPDRTLELLRFLVRLSACEHARLLASDQHSPALNRTSSNRIDAMVKLMHSSYGRPMGLEEVAQAAHMSPSSASRFFRRTTGTTITSYLNVLRVNAACVLLRDTDRRIADIAADCGYANLSNFNRRFLEIKKTSPRAYRHDFRQAELVD